MQSLTSPGVIAEYNIPTASSGANDITAGTVNLWFSEHSAHKIGKVTTTGNFSEYASPFSFPFGVMIRPDHNLWFASHNGLEGALGEMTGSGTGSVFFTGFGQLIYGLTQGPDGNLWFTLSSNGKENHHTWVEVWHHAGYLITSGFGHTIGQIITGPDRNLWFFSDNAILRITTTGSVAAYPVPTAASGLAYLTVGPDGNIWFTENSANKIGKITPGGVINEYPIHTPASGPLGITAGPDGNVWFTQNHSNTIGRITPTGFISEFQIPTLNSGPVGITKGPDGNLWFVEQNANKIAKFRP